MKESIDGCEIEAALLNTDMIRFHMSDGNGNTIVFRASRREAKQLAIGILAEETGLFLFDEEEVEAMESALTEPGAQE